MGVVSGVVHYLLFGVKSIRSKTKLPTEPGCLVGHPCKSGNCHFALSARRPGDREAGEVVGKVTLKPREGNSETTTAVKNMNCQEE